MAREGKTTLSRRRFLSLAAATSLGILAACTPREAAPARPTSEAPQPSGGDATPVPAPKEGLTLSCWIFWTQYGEFVEEFRKTDEYKEAMGDNQLDLQVGVGSEIFLTNIAAGTPPDIGTAGGGTYLDFMARGVVLPVDDLVATSTVVKPDAFLPGYFEACSYKGVQYGVPANECFVRYGLNYNERLAEEAGLDPDNPPQTWPEVFEWHKALTKFDAAGNLLQFGLDPYDAMGGAWFLAGGYFPADSWDFRWFDEETQEFNLDNEKMAEAFETMGEFIRYVGVDNLAGLRSVEGQGTWGGAFNAEVQAMIIEGYWHPGETAHEKPEVSKYNRATWVPVPEARRGDKIQASTTHMMQFFKGAPHPLEAFPFVEFLQSSAACDIMFAQVGWLPAYKAYLETVDPETFPGLEFYFRSTEEATHWYPPVRCEIEAFANTKFFELAEAVYRDQMTGAQAAREFQAACEQEWKAAGFAG